jgi:dihydrofolate reductase
VVPAAADEVLDDGVPVGLAGERQSQQGGVDVAAGQPGDLAEEIGALRNESGGEIMAHGGAAFVQALSRLSLIDEYRLVTLPVAVGSGLPLFKDLTKPLRVDLAEAKTFPDGTAIHVYRPAG